MKTLQTIRRPDGLAKAVVKFDEDWAEYQVWPYLLGKLNQAAIYHTDDEDDAVGTARLMIDGMK
jgi:hypothetical protein